MDLHWQEEQQAFQARVLIEENPDLALRPFRTFVGPATPPDERRTSRAERLIVTIIIGAVGASIMMAFGLPRELAALVASFAGGAALVIAMSPESAKEPRLDWTPLLAVYAPDVQRGAIPSCVTQISPDEFNHLGTEGFGTVVGDPRPGRTFGLFVDDHLVWPRTPPRQAHADDPEFGSA